MEAITSFDQLDLGKQYTYADYLSWQFEDRVELIKGWIHRMSPAPRRKHQSISRNIEGPIINHLKGKTCEVYNAPFDVRLTNKRKSTEHQQVTTVVQPDICVVCDPSKLDDLGCIGAPDWIIEILSPGNNKHELRRKFDLYEENGVREYWVVSPENQTITVFDLKGDKFVCRGVYGDNGPVPVGIFGDFSIEFDEVFC